jgi:hypothetical protein
MLSNYDYNKCGRNLKQKACEAEKQKCADVVENREKESYCAT